MRSTNRWGASARRAVAATLVAASTLLAASVIATGAGASSLAVSFTVSPINFGQVTEGTSVVGQSLITNNSTSPIYFLTASPNASNTLAEFHGSVGTCAGPVAPGATCDVNVAFTPHNTLLRSSTIFVTMAFHNSKGVVSRVNTVGAKVSGVGVRPSFALSDASAGSINVGSVGTASATITNNSNVGLDVVGAHLLTSALKTWNIAAVACPLVLAPKASCDVVVSFSPHHIGSATATLVVVMRVDGTKLPLSAKSTISGTGVPKGGHSALFSLSSFGFGSVTVGSSASGVVVLTNLSNSAEALAHDGIANNPSGSFSITGSTCTAPLAPLASCEVDVAFAPTNGTLFNATFTATVNRTVGTVTTAHFGVASLNGTGIDPSFTLGLPTYPTTTVGSSNDGQVTITNTSLVALTFQHAGLVGSDVASWKVSGSACAGTLAVNASCSLDLVFAPHRQGTLSITLNVWMQFGTAPHVHSVLVQGDPTATSILPSFTVSSPAFAATATGTSSTATATITNNSNVALAYDHSSVSGPNAGEFTVVSTTCAGQIAPTASCTVTVKFSPTESVAGTDTATLHVVDSIPATAPLVDVTYDAALSASVTV